MEESRSTSFASPGDFFLSAEELAKPDKIDEIEPGDLQYALDNSPPFVNYNPAGNAPTNACNLELTSNATVKVSGDTATVSTYLSNSSCSDIDAPDVEGEDIRSKVEFMYFFQITCEGMTLKEKDIDPIRDVQSPEFICTNALVMHQTKVLYKATGTTTVEGESAKYDSQSSITKQKASTSGGPCQVSTSKTASTNKSCIVTYVDTTSQNLRLDGAIYKYSGTLWGEFTYSQGLESGKSEEDIWFGSGDISFKINNWTGAMSYTDSITVPSYTATDKTNEESGTLESLQLSVSGKKRIRNLPASLLNLN
ncbi:hypothetical protein N9W79_01055 [bacterium]|nr:hypothetical protein [bacterium]